MRTQKWPRAFWIPAVLLISAAGSRAAEQPSAPLLESSGTRPVSKADFSSLRDQISVEARVFVSKYPAEAVEIAAVPRTFSLGLDSAGKLTASVTQQEFSSTVRLTSQNTVPLNTWVRVAFTYDGAVRRFGLFIDGNLDTERDLTFFHSGQIRPPAGTASLVTAPEASGLKVEGLRVWNRPQLFNGRWKPKAFLAVHTLRYRKELLLAWTPSLVPPPIPAKFILTVTGADGAEILRREYSGQEALKGAPIPIPRLVTGDYHLTVSQTETDGTSAVVVNQPWHYTVPETSLIDFRPDNVMTLRGKPFFPFGIYHVRTPDFATVAGHGFNFVIADNSDPVYHSARQRQDYVEAAAKQGLMTLMRGFTLLNPEHPHHVRGQRELNSYRGDANVLAWYVDDEPRSFDALVKSYEFAGREDPTHPAFMLHNQPPDFARVAVGGDVFSSDPYSFNIIPSSMIADWTLAARHAVRDLKPVWTTLQLYTFTSNNPGVAPWNDLPSPQKIRAESYLSLATGARGLIYYSFDDTYYKSDRMRGVHMAREFPAQWAAYKPVVQEIQSRANIWTAPLAQVAVQNQSPAVYVSERPYEIDGAWWVLAVNPAKDRDAEVHFTLASGRIQQITDALGHPKPKVNRGTITERIEPYGVRLYRIEAAKN